MHRKERLVAFSAVLVAIVLIVGACQREPEIVEKEVTREVQVEKEVTREVQVQVEKQVTKIVEKEVEKEVTVVVPATPVADIPFAALWVASGHANAEAEAFRHWDEDDPAEVPAACAKCHSTGGYHDFLGLDGTEYGTVENPAPLGTVIECVACHNEATIAMDSVVFPSGVEVTGLDAEARCMQCHQGRASTVSVNGAIESAGVGDDAVSEDLGFINIHYFAAAATKFGTRAMGGYQYEDKMYDAYFVHVEEYDTCVDCHDPHSLQLKIDECSTCHASVSGVEDVANIRWLGSLSDYDGDGDTEESVKAEIEGLQEVLYGAIQAYAKDNAATASIVYDSHGYPYFFIDTNDNGEVDEGEAAFPNRYASWTPRLLRAAYNYQTSFKDPGAYAHGGKYIIQLLFDSIEDLDASLVEGLQRGDAGHFDGSTEAFRHWDEDGSVPGRCSRCHSAGGLPMYLETGGNGDEPLSNGFLCSTCHDEVPGFTRYVVEAVTFPSGAELDTGNPDSNLCLNCHQGRESTVSVNRAIADLDLDTVSEDVGFRNVHYFAAGASLFGTEAKGAYEYDGKTYLGRFAHVANFDSCTDCHDAHALKIEPSMCSTCHAGADDPRDIRMSDVDFDGNGDAEEGIAREIETAHDALYVAIQEYAAEVAGTPIAYDSHAYPYWFTDAGERYASWTPRLLQAAYNYQYVAKDPGAFAHNGKYIIQILYDSLESLGAKVEVDLSAATRPASE